MNPSRPDVARPGVSRRDFLKVGFTAAAGVSLAGTVPGFVSRMAFAQTVTGTAVSNDNILVIVQLSGGNDGLNTVVPFRDDAYYKARPVLALKDRLHSLSSDLSLNPGMTAMKGLFDEGKLAVVNGCGYPSPNRSHFQSMHIWHTADPTIGKGSGWIGHYLDHALKGTDAANPLKAVNIGVELPAALVNTGAPVPSIQSLEDFALRLDPGSQFDATREKEIITALNSSSRAGNPALEFLSRQATNALVSTEEVRKLAGGYKPDAQYPGGGLGNQLKLIAQIISGNFGTRVFYCQTGGYDTHANQGQTHERLLQNVSDSLAAFQKDLEVKGLAQKVTVMCFSEFGRRVAQNESNGTDHGAAGPMFVLGSRVKGGVYGNHPSLTDTDNGDLKYTVDFRRVYATLLRNSLNADPSPILGGNHEPLGFL